MTGTLTFSLPEEQAEFRVAQDGGKWKRLVWDLDQLCRARLKYGNLPDQEQQVWQTVRDWLWQTVKEEDLSWDD